MEGCQPEEGFTPPNLPFSEELEPCAEQGPGCSGHALSTARPGGAGVSFPVPRGYQEDKTGMHSININAIINSPLSLLLACCQISGFHVERPSEAEENNGKGAGCLKYLSPSYLRRCK